MAENEAPVSLDMPLVSYNRLPLSFCCVSTTTVASDISASKKSGVASTVTLGKAVHTSSKVPGKTYYKCVPKQSRFVLLLFPFLPAQLRGSFAAASLSLHNHHAAGQLNRAPPPVNAGLTAGRSSRRCG